jgi:hypothetical protein
MPWLAPGVILVANGTENASRADVVVWIVNSGRSTCAIDPPRTERRRVGAGCCGGQEMGLRGARRLRGWWLVLVVLALVAGCRAVDGEGGEDRRAALGPPPPTPAAHRGGEASYVAHCARCHGVAARGATLGPPLVHPVYRPGHHADAAFLLAVRNGVAQHHWRFGNMPPQPQVATREVAPIVAYVRWLQRAAGID